MLNVPGIKEVAIIHMETTQGDPRFMLNKDDNANQAYKIYISSQYLIAYYTTYSDVELSSIYTYLKDKLPDYMIPQHYIRLPNMPLTHNGKLNYNAFPLPAKSS